ncbi:MAG: alanine--tRNA ligase [Candidatus Cloacimonadaceae bacterium]
MISSKDIRQQFIDFFIQKGHTFVPSSSVIPQDDPTLLFTNAGMNQFKSIFLGLKEPDFPRVVNSQKCIRAGGKHNDLEEVGKDGYHHTFFEMLGNWSFGDYYKKEAIVWAWELLTEIWKIPKEKLYATVHHSDKEAYEIWLKDTDIEPSHVSFHGDKDNFWEMGETGPCGPCSEIHIDRGEGFCDRAGTEGHVCGVNTGCARFIELWNLVFIQYNRDEAGKLHNLKHKYVDTGAGLERICQILQGQVSNYHTDLFLPLLEKITELTGVPYSSDDGMSHRVITDHVRCLCFALADGGFPSNEGRGYVLRRILRRAARHGHLLGMHEPFLYKLVDTVIEIMGHHYQELTEKRQYIKAVIKAEEERFNQTLDTGLEKFNEVIQKLQGDTISGKDAFLLYDTYGFPLDLTALMAEEKGLKIDTGGFEEEMEKQKQRARQGSNFKADNLQLNWIELLPNQETEFVGYEHNKVRTHISKYCLLENDDICVQLEHTPFYAEAGGQVADVGKIFNEELSIIVTDVKKMNGSIVHYGKLEFGLPDTKEVIAEIDLVRRKRIARNHTVTHLLHKALRSVLGEHVQQKGSLVAPEYLRFDFAHFEAVSHQDLRKIEQIVNEQIRNNLPVTTQIMTLEEARKNGAMALFGEKYGDRVRVVSVEGFSKELCGGTHVHATGEIGIFKIMSETSSAAGIRRIEAVTGDTAENWIYELQDKLALIAQKLNTSENKLSEKVAQILERQKELESQLAECEEQKVKDTAAKLIRTSIPIKDGKLILAKVNAASKDELRKLGDKIKAIEPDCISALFAVIENEVIINVAVGKDLLPKYKAGDLVKQISSFVGGKGGGNPTSAMGSGKDVSKLDMAMGETLKLLTK